MNPIAEEILMHYGMPRRSGRYPWGSGDNPYQHSGDFLSRVDELKKQGFSEKEIAEKIGLTTTQLRTQMSLAKDERRSLQVATAKGLREKGYSLNEIAEKMGFANDSSVRSLLNENSETRMNQAKTTANFLKQMIDEKGMIDVGTGVERELGISREKLNQALYILELEGYPVYGGGVPQVTNPGKQTNIKVVCPPGTEHREIYDFDNVHSVKDYEKVLTEDGQKVRPAFQYPESMDSSRLKINYAEEGGIHKDGVIEIRRGVEDLSLGDSHYAQVRIMVDGTHYLKGMAVYSDDLPDGVDVLFNTNKKVGTPMTDVLKKIKDDPDNPFGSLIKEHGGQSYYIDANMATVEFKQSLLDTALAMGTVVKVGDEYQTTTTDAKGKVSDLFTATSAFNDSLSAQWMTTDVLVQTLSNYATDIREMTAEEKKAYEEKLRGVGYEEIVCDANNLYKAYKASIKGSKWKETTQKFMINFLRYLIAIQDDLLNRTLQNGPTEEFSLSERGRVRPITSIRIHDRIVRHVLCDEVLLPEVRKHIIYDNGASIKGRGISHQRDRFEVHLRRYYKLYGNEGWILFGDFSKFYDNIIHEIAKRELLKLFNDDEFIDWLLTLIFDGFKIDVSYMSEEEYASCMENTFNKLDYRDIPKSLLTGEKWMYKSVNIGDQLSQIIGIYYPYRIDNYVKYVRSQKFYGRYMDDWYIMNPSKEELQDLLENICRIAKELGIHINTKKTRIVKISSTYKYLQIRYSLTKDGKIIKRINPTRVTTMRRKLKKLVVKVQEGEIQYENVENMFRGWMGSFYKLLSKQQRQNLITLYEELFGKTIAIVNKKMIVVDKLPQKN